MIWTNDLTQLFKVKYPIIQAPMLGVTTPEMVAAVSNEGGLGSLPVGLQTPAKTLELIQKTKSLTTQPFAVNLFAHDLPEVNVSAISDLQNRIFAITQKYGLEYNLVEIEKTRHYSYRDQIEIIIAEQVPVVSFTFGIIDQESIRRFHDAGILLIGTATSVREAMHLENIGIDVITAQGIEAGGHRGTFLFDEPLPQVGSMSLIPQVADQVQVPILAAGGIMDGRSIRAAMILGAQGVQVGSAFLRSDESLGIDVYKNAVGESADTDTVLTRTFSGRWARGIRNTFHNEVEKLNLDYPAYPLLNDITVPIRTASQKNQNKEFTTLWAGQSARFAKAKSSAEIFRDLVNETESLKIR
jgi:nitronate monooxygenase